MFSQTAIYALRATGGLAARYGQGPMQAPMIAAEMGIPKNFLSKIMHQLVRSGLVRSIRGIHGGFILVEEPSKTTLKDVVAPFMDLTAARNCLLGRRTCDGTCRLHQQWRPIADQIADFLQKTTIDQI